MISVTLTDYYGGADTASSNATVSNVAPQGVVIDSAVQNYVFAVGEASDEGVQYSERLQ